MAKKIEKQISVPTQIHRLLKRLPNRIQKSPSIASETWEKFGPLKIPIKHQKQLRTNLKNLIGKIEYRENRLVFVKELDTTGGNLYEGQILYKRDNSDIV